MVNLTLTKKPANGLFVEGVVEQILHFDYSKTPHQIGTDLPE